MLLALLISTPGLEDQVRLQLLEPSTRLVAVVSIPEKCERCGEEAARWRALVTRHHARGLRTIALVGRSPMFGCIDPGWSADESICDAMYDGLARRYRLPERSSIAFLWNGKGRLIVNRGDLSAMESAVKRQLAASLPRILLSPDQRDLRAGNMYEPAVGSSHEVARARAPCERGQGLDADAVL